MRDRQLEAKVAELVNRIPPMPEHLERILADELRADREDLMAIVRRDPGVCSELLHLANSECFAEMGVPETIEEAAACVDVTALAQMIGVSYAQEVIEEHFARMENLDEYFAHSREISRAAGILAAVTGLDEHRRRIYETAGLIHDVGRLVILLACDRTSVSLMGTDWEAMTRIVNEERELLGMDHTVVGRGLCAKWNFAPVLTEAVLRHHTPLLGTDYSAPGALIFTAHFLAASDFTGEILERMLPGELLGKMRLTVDEFNEGRELFRRNEG